MEEMQEHIRRLETQQLKAVDLKPELDKVNKEMEEKNREIEALRGNLKDAHSSVLWHQIQLETLEKLKKEQEASLDKKQKALADKDE